MGNFGNRVQFEVYQTMPNPAPDRLPVVFEEWEARAREVLEDGPYHYVAGDAGS